MPLKIGHRGVDHVSCSGEFDGGGPADAGTRTRDQYNLTPGVLVHATILPFLHLIPLLTF
jgi:hypothetical protein